MRKVIVSMNVTLDGFMAGPDSELDWHFNYWNEEMAETATEQLSKVDTILLGRITYAAMSQYWPYQMNNLAFPRRDIAFADMMNSYKKIVFSKTIRRASWNNSKLIKGNLAQEVELIKSERGRDIIVFGSGSIVSELIQANLIDEYQLWVHPIYLGDGKPLFENNTISLKLLYKKELSSGVTIYFYTPKKI